MTENTDPTGDRPCSDPHPVQQDQAQQGQAQQDQTQRYQARWHRPIMAPPQRYLAWGAIAAGTPPFLIMTLICLSTSMRYTEGHITLSTLVGYALFLVPAFALGGATCGAVAWLATIPVACRTELPGVRALAAALALFGALWLAADRWLLGSQRMDTDRFIMLLAVAIGAYGMSFWHEQRALVRRSRQPPGL